MNSQDRCNMEFGVAMDIVVTGQDGEFADMSNPQGYLFGDAHFVVCTNTVTGQRWRHDHQFINDHDSALAFSEKIAATPADYKFDEDCWEEWHPVYGSAYYQSSGEEQKVRQLEKDGVY